MWEHINHHNVILLLLSLNIHAYNMNRKPQKDIYGNQQPD
jgi:hypothetical protein